MDTDYWLGHCEGFRVDGPCGRVGVVEHVVYGSRVDRPDVVAVSSGGWRAFTVKVPVADVVNVLPGQRRLMVRNGGVEGVGVWAWAQRAIRGAGSFGGAAS